MSWKNILLIVLCLFLMSCDGNGSDYSGNASFVNGKIEAAIGGTQIKIPTYLVRKSINAEGTELISIHGYDCDWCVSFQFESIMGAQHLENQNLFIEMHRRLINCEHMHGYNETGAYSLIDGEINLIENSDKRVKGTFGYAAKNRMGNTVNVTDGTFDIATGN